MQAKNCTHLILPLLLVFLLSSCASRSGGDRRYSIRQDHGPSHEVNVKKIPNAIPRVEPRSKYGNPKSYVVLGQRYSVMNSSSGYIQRGVASWYGKKFHGHRTSSGETYNMYGMTAAHKHLPLPTYVQVTNLENKRSIIVKVNDRGPFHDNRIIDLSYVAAKKLGIGGTGKVEVRAIDPRQFAQQKKRRVSMVDHFAKNSPPAAPVPSKDKNADTKRVFLQVGAFSERENADELTEQLAGLIESGEINTGYNVTQKLYRVRIGPLASAEEANKLAQKISQAGIAKPRVVLD